MSTASAHVNQKCPITNTSHRLESGLEADAMTVFMARRDVVGIRTQYRIEYRQEGKVKTHYADLCVDFINGCRTLYAVRNTENAAKLMVILEHIRNHELKKHATAIKLLTEKEISKPLVYRAKQILRARELTNEKNNEHVLKTLINLGGEAKAFQLLRSLPEHINVSACWTAVWSLIDRGLVIHDHPNAHHMTMSEISDLAIVRR